MSHPIWIRDPQGATCQMSVLIMPHCPVNLLGRDGLTALGLALIPTEDDRIVVRRKHELSGSDTYVLKEKGTPFYYYSLDVPNRPPMEVGKQLLDKGRQIAIGPRDEMKEEDLHVTMWYKQTTVPDPRYDEKLRDLGSVRVTLTNLYWDKHGNVAAAVSLSKKAEKLFRMFKPPHISLCKNRNDEWRDVGQMVLDAENADDWVDESSEVDYSPSCMIRRKALWWTTDVRPGVHLDPGKT